jgi:hypothetical protein
MMTNGAGWVQNRGQYNGAGGQATARSPKFRVERRPLLAPEVFIFGVDFTGPYIVVVNGGPVDYYILLILPLPA